MKISISTPRPMKQAAIPKPSVGAFSANHALGMSGQSPARSVFRPIAKDPAPPKTSWTGK